jgi:hypothetical protein
MSVVEAQVGDGGTGADGRTDGKGRMVVGREKGAIGVIGRKRADRSRSGGVM